MHTRSNVKKNTVCTIACRSVTFHSLSYLHARNLPERTTKMHYKQTWAYHRFSGCT